MTTHRKSYLTDVIDVSVLAALALLGTFHFGLPTAAGVILLVLWVVSLARVGVLIGAWASDRRPRRWSPQERQERAESAARHPSRRRPVPASVEDHYSGPRKIIGPTRDGQEAIMATHDGREYEVHNHGPHEGRGLECPEYVTKDGRYRGACIVQAEIARAYGMETNR